MSEKLSETIKEYVIIIFGTVLVAFAAKNLLDPASLVTGGVSGAAIVIKYFTGIPLWVSNTALNIPIFFLYDLHIFLSYCFYRDFLLLA